MKRIPTCMKQIAHTLISFATFAPPVYSASLHAVTKPKALSRWDTKKGNNLTIGEYKAGLKDQENLEQRFKSFDKHGDGEALTRSLSIRLATSVRD